ncbi:hypothetical protein MBLNU457_g1106t2 [Dothideomycetes sp. NU457]
MMPSRGLTPFAGSVRSFAPSARASSRFLSTAVTRQHPRTTVRPQILSQRFAGQRRNISWSPSTWLGGSSSTSTSSNATATPSLAETAPVTASNLAPANTTSGSTPVPSASNSASVAASPAQNPADLATDITNINLDTIHGGDYPLATMPEHIGYMKELGIEYGYGLTSSLEWLLEHIHVYSGMPWWGSIITTAFLTRLVIFPFFLKSSDTTGRMGAVQHLIKPKMEEMTAASQAGDSARTMALKTEVQSMFRRAGIKFRWLIIPMGLQFYTAICALRLMRASSSLPVPGFVDGGALWFYDLSVADPYLALPALMGITMHLIFRFGGEAGAEAFETAPALKPLMLYIMPVAIFISMAWFPAGVNLWLATTGLFGVAQGKLLQNAKFRDALGVAPMIKPTKKTLAPKIEESIKRIQPRRIPGSMQYQAPTITTRLGEAPSSRPQDTGMVNGMKETINSVSNSVTAYFKNTRKDAEKIAEKNPFWGGGGAKKKVDSRGAEFEMRAEQYEREAKQARRQGRN